jgi:hypothetical protein
MSFSQPSNVQFKEGFSFHLTPTTSISGLNRAELISRLSQVIDEHRQIADALSTDLFHVEVNAGFILLDICTMMELHDHEIQQILPEADLFLNSPQP